MDLPQLLGNAEISEKASKLKNWKLIDYHHMEAIFKFKDFEEALDFVVKVGYIAEKMQHHPEINLSWGRVFIKIFTHDRGGLTVLDFKFAIKVNEISKMEL
jgi:4a-hydroxytetrahydrobiopterin dehydratase